MSNTITTAEAAALLQVTPGRVRHLIAAGQLDATRPDAGRSHLITRESVERYIATGRRPGRRPKGE